MNPLLEFVLILIGGLVGMGMLLFVIAAVAVFFESLDPDSRYNREERRLEHQRQVNRAKRRDHLEHELLTGPFTGHRWDCPHPDCTRQRDSLAA